MLPMGFWADQAITIAIAPTQLLSRMRMILFCWSYAHYVQTHHRYTNNFSSLDLHNIIQTVTELPSEKKNVILAKRIGFCV